MVGRRGSYIYNLLNHSGAGITVIPIRRKEEKNDIWSNAPGSNQI